MCFPHFFILTFVFTSIYLNISYRCNCCSKISSLRIFEVTKVDSLSAKIQKMYGYSDYEMALIKYSVTAMLSEISKIVILSIFYLFIGKFDLFVAFLALLIFLRINGGGYHWQALYYMLDAYNFNICFSYNCFTVNISP